MKQGPSIRSFQGACVRLQEVLRSQETSPSVQWQGLLMSCSIDEKGRHHGLRSAQLIRATGGLLYSRAMPMVYISRFESSCAWRASAPIRRDPLCTSAGCARWAEWRLTCIEGSAQRCGEIQWSGPKKEGKEPDSKLTRWQSGCTSPCPGWTAESCMPKHCMLKRSSGVSATHIDGAPLCHAAGVLVSRQPCGICTLSSDRYGCAHQFRMTEPEGTQGNSGTP